MFYFPETEQTRNAFPEAILFYLYAFIVNFEHISYLVLVFILLTWKM